MKLKTLRKIGYFLGLFLISLGLTAGTVKSPSVYIPVFGFHDIIDLQDKAEIPPQRPSYNIDYTKQDLEKFLDYLVREDYWFLSSQDLFIYFIKKSKPIPPEHLGQKAIVLTFDDGYKGVHKNALPILKKLEDKYGKKGKFVLFVNPWTMGIDNNMKDLSHVSCNNLREGYKSGFYDIQSHGFSHKNLAELDGKELELELYLAKFALRKCTHDLDRNKIVAAHIAYPYGAINKRVEKLLPKYHLTGFLYDDNLVKVNRLRNKYHISRVTVNNKTSPYKLIRLAKKASTLSKNLKWKKVSY
ncbi:MAG: polysaccharide deacetylase family protein [Okeania sp. SIO2H7]|nr:polysaccharide deacetylase family protein [Okeania sp. SIO2H7]